MCPVMSSMAKLARAVGTAKIRSLMKLLLNWYRLASFGPGRSGTILQQVEVGASGGRFRQGGKQAPTAGCAFALRLKPPFKEPRRSPAGWNIFCDAAFFFAGA
jgi:hypothetical protein